MDKDINTEPMKPLGSVLESVLSPEGQLVEPGQCSP